MQNYSIPSDDRSVLARREIYASKLIIRTAKLLFPIVTSIGSPKDRSCQSTRSADINVGKMHGIEMPKRRRDLRLPVILCLCGKRENGRKNNNKISHINATCTSLKKSHRGL